MDDCQPKVLDVVGPVHCLPCWAGGDTPVPLAAGTAGVSARDVRNHNSRFEEECSEHRSMCRLDGARR